MEKIKLKIITFVKAVVFMFLFVGILIGNLLLFEWLTGSVNWMICSLFISLTEMVLLMFAVYPYVFKEYIKYFYEKKGDVQIDTHKIIWGDCTEKLKDISKQKIE